MATEKTLTSLVINKIDSQETYNKMKAQGLINEDELYLTPESTTGGSSESGIYFVQLVGTDVSSEYTLSTDTTISDINSAYDDNKLIWCKFTYENYAVQIPLTNKFNGTYQFYGSIGDDGYNDNTLADVTLTVVITSSGNVDIYPDKSIVESEITTNIPDTASDDFIPTAKAVVNYVTRKLGAIENGTY